MCHFVTTNSIGVLTVKLGVTGGYTAARSLSKADCMKSFGGLISGRMLHALGKKHANVFGNITFAGTDASSNAMIESVIEEALRAMPSF